ncbi:MAG: DUF4197 domain-containing protein [Fibromonadaceae bacterium]|nr:DUF4197 domain-containing protein [Fibromonadaceae bacterium]
MRKFLIACSFSAVATFGLFSCGNHLFDQDLESRMVGALQEALVLGSKTAAVNLGDSSCSSSLAAAGNCTKGYLGNKLVEILLPDTVSNVLKQINSFTGKLNALPFPVKTVLETAVGHQYNSLFNLDGYATSLKNALNRGAEQAAPASVEVFENTIRAMSFADARDVLMGDSIAATSYLKTTTYKGLQGAFRPVIKIPLDKLNPNQHWSPIASAYNSFAEDYAKALKSSAVISAISSYNTLNPSSDKISLPGLPYNGYLSTDLSESLTSWATGKALDGLFRMVGKQETQLRADPWGTVKSLGDFVTDNVGDLLSDIFGRAKDGLL